MYTVINKSQPEIKVIKAPDIKNTVIKMVWILDSRRTQMQRKPENPGYMKLQKS
jgi:hypothetical protein